MRDEDLSLLARLARALFPEEAPDPADQQMFLHPVIPSSGWQAYDGVWINTLGRDWIAGRHAVQIPGLHATPHVLERALAGRPPEDPTTRDILADPEVGAALPDGRFTLLREDVVVCRDASHEDIVALVRAIDAARRRPWKRLASTLGLPLDERALSIVGRTGGLLGHRERFDVRVHEERRHTRVRIALMTPLDDGVAITAGVPADEDKLHHPILDRKIVARGVDRALRRKLLEVEQPLLNLLAAYPESDVDPRRIRIVAKGRLLSDLPGLVDDALALARALA